MLSNKIVELRERYNISQTQLAKKLNIGRQTLSNWENDNAVPSIAKLEDLADFFGVSTDYLLDRDNREYLDVTGLTPEELAPIKQIIAGLKKHK